MFLDLRGQLMVPKLISTGGLISGVLTSVSVSCGVWLILIKVHTLYKIFYIPVRIFFNMICTLSTSNLFHIIIDFLQI